MTRVSHAQPTRSNQLIDLEIQRLLQQTENRVRDTLAAHRRELEALAEVLLQQETVERDVLLKIIGPADDTLRPKVPAAPAAA